VVGENWDEPATVLVALPTRAQCWQPASRGGRANSPPA